MTTKTTQSIHVVPALPRETPVFPLSPQQRADYQALLDLYQKTMDNTTDPVVLTAINPSYLDVADLLTKDNMYKLHQTTALFTALKEQFDTTNDGLKQLAAQIAATTAHFVEAATILAAMNKAFPYLAAL